MLNCSLPSASHPPSIWYEAVAAPKRKPSGNVKLSWAAANPVATKMTKQTVWNLISLQCQAPCTWECQSIREIVSLYVRVYVRVCVCEWQRECVCISLLTYLICMSLHVVYTIVIKSVTLFVFISHARPKWKPMPCYFLAGVSFWIREQSKRNGYLKGGD